MANKLLNISDAIRFSLQGSSKGNYYSSRWTCFLNKKNLYLSEAANGGLHKVSLHESGDCRYAFTQNLASHSPPFPNNERIIIKWSRGRFQGILHTQVFSIKFIKVQNWVNHTHQSKKPILALSAPPNGYCREVAIFFSETNPFDWSHSVWPTSNILGVWKISENNFATIRTRIIGFPESKRTSLIKSIETQNTTKVVMGEENPSIFTAGHYSCLVSEATKCHGALYSLEGVPQLNFAAKAAWSCKAGNKPKAGA